MASQYGIGVTRNRFELFDSDEDPLEVLKQHEMEKEERKKIKVSGKENATTKGLVIQKVPGRKVIGKETISKPLETKVKKPKEAPKRLGRISQAKSDGVVNARNNESTGSIYMDNKPADDRIVTNEKLNQNDEGTNKSFRFSNRNRGANQDSSGFETRGRNQFDHDTDSDRISDNKESSGNYNWDNKTVLKEVTDRGSNDKWDGDKATETPKDVTTTEQTEESNNNIDEAAKQMTLDEWKALRVPRAKPILNIRKAGEGEDLTRWKKMYALERKNAETEEEEEEYEHCEYPQRVGRQKHLLDIDIRFKDSRTTRGRGRGGVFRGAGRNVSPRDPDMPVKGNSRKEVPKVDNEHEFPSLG